MKAVKFQIEKDANIYLDMRDTHLSLKLQLSKNYSKECSLLLSKKSEHKGKSEDDSDEEP